MNNENELYFYKNLFYSLIFIAVQNRTELQIESRYYWNLVFG